MKLWSSLQELFLGVKKKQYVPYLILSDFNAAASRWPILCFWAPLRKITSQKRRTIFFVTQMPIFQHKHTNMSPFVSLIVLKSLFHVSGQGLDACSEQQVPPFLTLFFRRKGEAELDFICVVFSFFLFFFCTFIECLVKYLTQMRRWLILEVKPFRLKEIAFSLCFQNLISQVRHEWHFPGFSTRLPYIFQLFAVST